MKKAQDKEFFDKIKNLLIKKAEGYFYSEEINEYQTSNGEKIVKEESKNKEINQTEHNKNEQRNEEKANLTLLKKKVTTHYIPPDLLAVKMLIEIFGQKVESANELESLEYNQLIELKNQLIESLKNENNGG